MPLVPTSTMPALPWSSAKKVLFRASFLFFILFFFFVPNAAFPGADQIYKFYIQPFHQFIPWVGAHILHLSYPITTFPLGSGDTTFDYVVLLFSVFLTVLGCLIWTLADRQRPSYNTTYYWLTVAIRYYCAFNMIFYGFTKIYKLQFPFPGPGSLIQPFGTFSPMHLAWAFLGFSKGYNYFMGFAEVTTGILLLFRRTTRLGAILLLVVSANIMAVNYCFDVCVKVLSSMLVLMALFLLLQDRRRLIDFFLRNKPTLPSNESRQSSLRVSRLLIALKFALILIVLIGHYSKVHTAESQYSDDRIQPRENGLYNVKSFVRDKDTIAPLITDTSIWRRLVIQDRFARVYFMNDNSSLYAFHIDTSGKKAEMYLLTDTLHKLMFTYSYIGKDSLYLQGKFRDDSLAILLAKFDRSQFILANRGFHFINEAPYQR